MLGTFRQRRKVDKAHQDSIWSVLWTSTGLLCTASVDETVRVWDAADESTDKAKFLFEGHELSVVDLACTQDGKTLVSSSMDGAIRVYDLEEGKALPAIEAGPTETWSVSVHPTRPLVASGSHTGKINFFNLFETTKHAKELDAGTHFILDTQFSAAGDRLVASAHDGSVYVFDVETNKQVARFNDHVKPVRTVALSPDGQTLVSGSDDHHLNVYSLKNNEQMFSLAGHQSWVLGASFSPTQNVIVSTSSDTKTKVWTLDSGECVHTFATHAQPVWGVTHSPDGKSIATVSDDASLQIFDCYTA